MQLKDAADTNARKFHGALQEVGPIIASCNDEAEKDLSDYVKSTERMRAYHCVCSGYPAQCF